MFTRAAILKALVMRGSEVELLGHCFLYINENVDGDSTSDTVCCGGLSFDSISFAMLATLMFRHSICESMLPRRQLIPSLRKVVILEGHVCER